MVTRTSWHGFSRSNCSWKMPPTAVSDLRLAFCRVSQRSSAMLSHSGRMSASQVPNSAVRTCAGRFSQKE